MKRIVAGVGVLAFAALAGSAAAAPKGALHGRAQAAALAARSSTLPPAQGKRRIARHTSLSTNWSGYVSCFVDSTTPCGDTFSSVTGTWTEPTDDCSAVKGQQETVASFWSGLDGWWNGTVEQTGTDTICIGKTQYDIPWVEFYPARPITYSDTVQPGDTLTATVSQNGTTVTATLHDSTQGWTESTTHPAAGLAFNSAEWIAEGATKRLTDFRTVDFSGADATDTSNHSGPIDDTTWGYDSVEMVTKSGGSFHYAIRAEPDFNSFTGTAFTVDWMHF